MITNARHGYLPSIDREGLLAWALEHPVSIRLFVRPGDYVYPGTTIAVVVSARDGADEAIVKATALGAARVSADDLEFPI